MRSFEIDNAAVTDRQIEEQASSAQKKFLLDREYDSAKATAVVAGGEAGITGLSLDSIIGDLGAQQDQRLDAVTQNAGIQTAQLQRQREGIAVNTENRINSVQRGTKPSALALALQIGGTILSSASKAQNQQTQQTSATFRG
jgi:hypothetical protein